MAARQVSPIENRKSPRRVFRKPVGILLHGEYHVCQALQLGEGGMLAIVNLDIAAGTKIVASMFLPGGGYALIQAEVLYSVDSEEGKAYGMKFDTVPLAQKRFIRNYVSAKTEQEAKDELLQPDFMRGH